MARSSRVACSWAGFALIVAASVATPGCGPEASAPQANTPGAAGVAAPASGTARATGRLAIDNGTPDPLSVYRLTTGVRATPAGVTPIVVVPAWAIVELRLDAGRYRFGARQGAAGERLPITPAANRPAVGNRPAENRPSPAPPLLAPGVQFEVQEGSYHLWDVTARARYVRSEFAYAGGRLSAARLKPAVESPTGLHSLSPGLGLLDELPLAVPSGETSRFKWQKDFSRAAGGIGGPLPAARIARLLGPDRVAYTPEALGLAFASLSATSVPGVRASSLAIVLLGSHDPRAVAVAVQVLEAAPDAAAVPAAMTLLSGTPNESASFHRAASVRVLAACGTVDDLAGVMERLAPARRRAAARELRRSRAPAAIHWQWRLLESGTPAERAAAFTALCEPRHFVFPDCAAHLRRAFEALPKDDRRRADWRRQYYEAIAATLLWRAAGRFVFRLSPTERNARLGEALISGVPGVPERLIAACLKYDDDTLERWLPLLGHALPALAPPLQQNLVFAIQRRLIRRAAPALDAFFLSALESENPKVREIGVLSLARPSRFGTPGAEAQLRGVVAREPDRARRRDLSAILDGQRVRWLAKEPDAEARLALRAMLLTAAPLPARSAYVALRAQVAEADRPAWLDALVEQTWPRLPATNAAALLLDWLEDLPEGAGRALVTRAASDPALAVRASAARAIIHKRAWRQDPELADRLGTILLALADRPNARAALRLLWARAALDDLRAALSARPGDRAHIVPALARWLTDADLAVRAEALEIARLAGAHPAIDAALARGYATADLDLKSRTLAILAGRAECAYGVFDRALSSASPYERRAAFLALASRLAARPEDGAARERIETAARTESAGTGLAAEMRRWLREHPAPSGGSRTPGD